jgi:DNA-binding PadR family transcriptional regulator
MALKYAILGLLHYKDMHGYRIKEHIERNFGHMWSINFGQIYPNLKKLKEQRLIKMREETQNGGKGPPRKLYSLTPKGRDEFKKWLESSPERGMLMRDPFLMRFVFFRFGDKSRAMDIIEEQIGVYRKQLAHRYENKKRWQNENIFVKRVVDLGIHLNEAFIEWLEQSKVEIAEEFEATAEDVDAVADYIAG